MHPTSYEEMKKFRNACLDPTQRLKILDVGSRDINGTYKPLFADVKNWEYVGLDIEAGENVDIVSEYPYDYPLDAESFDILISGQVLEHIEEKEKWMRELYRILKPDGYCFITAPWQWEIHAGLGGDYRDYWRVLPDGMRYLMESAGFRVAKVYIKENDCVGIGKKAMSPRSPKVTVLLPTYRRPFMIERALKSVYRQDFHDWELIVIENGSTPEIHEQYVEHVLPNFPKDPWIYWITEPWASLPRALNVGLERARGEYIAVQEDDDEWLARFLGTLVGHMDDCECGMAYAYQAEVLRGKPISRFTPVPDHFDRNSLLTGNYISFPMALTRKEALEQIGGFHEEAGPATDWIAWCKIAKDWPICLVKEMLIIHHWHEDPGAPNYCLAEPGDTPSSMRYTLLQRRMLADGEFGPLPAEEK